MKLLLPATVGPMLARSNHLLPVSFLHSSSVKEKFWKPAPCTPKKCVKLANTRPSQLREVKFAKNIQVDMPLDISSHFHPFHLWVERKKVN
jgi:hypothetical protein